MQLINIEKQDKLDNFIAEVTNNRFLQSWGWGEFQKKIGNKIIRLGVENESKLLAAATLIKKTLPMGKSYFYSPQGPVIISDFRFQIPARPAGGRQAGGRRAAGGLDLLFKKIRKIAKKEKAIFLRFEPKFPITQVTNFPIFKTIDVQPSKTLVLGLNKSEEELLKNMHQKTRYNIRLAKKKGVKIREADDMNIDFEKFWNLMNDTKDRDRFRIHNKTYYKKMLEIDFIKLFLADYQEETVAVGIFSFFGDSVVYMHGASANKYRNIMAPYLLQWQIVLQAKKQGYKYYDFYGIDEDKWPGVTRFKKGFGGKEIKYPGTFDLVFNGAMYNIYKIGRKIRRNI